MDSSHGGKRVSLSLRSTQHSPRGHYESKHTDLAKQHSIRLSRADVKAAFAFFDVQNKKELKASDLKVRLSAFYPGMTNKEFKFLLGESAGGNFTEETLWNIIDNYHKMQTSEAVADNLRFEPVWEAFRIYDPKNSGFVDVDALVGIMKRIGLGDVSQEEIDMLIKAADFDKDGKININDFQNLLRIGRW